VTRPMDLPYGQDPVLVSWRKVRWRCPEQACPRGSFTEAIAEVPAGARTTARLRRSIAHAVGDAVLTEPEPTTVLGSTRPAGASPPGSVTRLPAPGCASTPTTPGSWIWPTPRACSGSARAHQQDRGGLVARTDPSVP